MFLPRQIIYFNSFQFKNGNTSKTKYFIVLANSNDDIIIASLPTRTNTVPSFVTVDHGCINIDERCYNSYLFKKDQVIGENGFSFDMSTFIYGDQVEDYKCSDIATSKKKTGQLLSHLQEASPYLSKIAGSRSPFSRPERIGANVLLSLLQPVHQNTWLHEPGRSPL